MAKYGTGLYNAGFKYGQSSAVTAYYTSNIAAWSYDYGNVRLSWGAITPDPTDNPPTHWMLVKSYSGTPDDPYAAIRLLGGTFSTFVNSYEDIDYGNTSREVNYSIWVFNGAIWRFCGSDNTVIVGDDDTLQKLTGWLPKAWLNPVEYTGEALGQADSSTFVSTLGAYSFMYDELRAKASLLGKTFNKAYTPISILQTKVTDFGFSYEAALGDTYHRSLLGSANIINGNKGTALGLTTYTSALTHWTDKVGVGHNILLDYNDSSFEESKGRWVTNLGTLTHRLYANSVADFGSAHIAPVPYLIDPLFLPRDKGFMSLTTSSTSPATMSLPSSSSYVVNYAAPIKPNTRYVFSGWVKHFGTKEAAITAKITWYDGYGNILSTTSPGTTVTTTANWKEFQSLSDSGRNGKLSPERAVYAGLQVVVTPAHSNPCTYAFDMFQLAEADMSLEFQDARKVLVYVKGEFENLLPNPSFERGVGGWFASPNGSFAKDPTLSSNAIFYGSAAGELTVLSEPVVGDPGVYVSSDWFEVTPGENYSFSAYLSTAYPDFGTAIARIEFSNRESLNEQVSISTDEDGNYYDNTIYYVDSDPITLETTTVINPATGLNWVDEFLPGNPDQNVPIRQRISVSALAPEVSRDAGKPLAKVSIYYPDAPVGESTWIDGALFESNPNIDSFFCGDGAPTPSNPVTSRYFSNTDSKWEYKNIINVIENPSFELVTGSTVNNWSASGITLTRDAGPGTYSQRLSNTDGTLQNVIVDSVPYTPLYGTYMGKCVYNTAVGGSISTTVYLTSPAIGGEDFVVSASVRAAEGVYTISTSGGGVTSSNQTQVFTHDQFQWIGIHTVRQLVAGETSFTLTISIAPPPDGYWDAVPTNNFFHIDGVQAEYGTIPNAFANPAATTTGVLPNPGHPASNMYVAQLESTDAGKSSYFSNFTTKFSRLKNTLGKMMPAGTSWAIKVGYPTETYPDLTESLIPSASFEKDLGSWVGNNSSLSRVVSRGSLFGDHVTHASAYCNVKATSLPASFGIETGHVEITPDGGFYASVAVRPANSDSFGDYTLRVDFYDAFDNEIVAYLDNITGAYTTASVDQDDEPNTLATDAARSTTSTIIRDDRWAYIADTFPQASITGASYAIFSVTFNPASAIAGQAFHIDRCVFRQ